MVFEECDEFRGRHLAASHCEVFVFDVSATTDDLGRNIVWWIQKRHRGAFTMHQRGHMTGIASVTAHQSMCPQGPNIAGLRDLAAFEHHRY